MPNMQQKIKKHNAKIMSKNDNKKAKNDFKKMQLQSKD